MARKTIPPEVNEEAARRQASKEFSIARAEAINAYANFEHHFAILFRTLLGVDSAKAFAVFGAVINSRARIRMIERLLHLSFGDKYSTFFNSLRNKLQGLDEVRNRIAHWLVLQQHRDGAEFKPNTDIFLSEHPNTYARGKIYKHELEHFSKQADFYRLLVFYFAMHLENPAATSNDPSKRAWEVIFLEEVAYPPPEDHPLHRRYKIS